MSDKISHSGIIESLSDHKAQVRIVQSSACSSCKVASYCTSAESKEKVIDVMVVSPEKFTVGQNVTIVGASSIGAKAVILAFVVPTVILLAAIIICLALGTEEYVAALVGIATLVPYYIILYAFRNRLEKMLIFYLQE